MMTERDWQEEYRRRTRHLDVADDEALAEAVRVLKELTGKKAPCFQASKP